MLSGALTEGQDAAAWWVLEGLGPGRGSHILSRAEGQPGTLGGRNALWGQRGLSAVSLGPLRTQRKHSCHCSGLFVHPPPPVFFLISMVFCAPTIGGLAYRHLTLLPAGPQADQAPGKDLGLRVLKGLWM